MEPRIIPDQQKYADFLLEPYKPGKPSVVVFKDPYCGYCIRALGNLERLDEYNVYMFWAGILGKRSKDKVNAIMQCNEPVSQPIFDNVMARSREVSCEQANEERQASWTTSINKW